MYKHLATMADMWDSHYTQASCLLSFSLLRSSIQALGGARSSRVHAVWPVDLIITSPILLVTHTLSFYYLALFSFIFSEQAH